MIQGWHGFNSKVITTSSTPSTETFLDADSLSFNTRALHAGARPCKLTGARAVPIYQSTSFVFDSADHAADLFNLSKFGNIYGRLSNPTVAVLEERVASLEGGRGATCTSSGHAAQLLTLFTLMSGPGDALVASKNLYGGSITQFSQTIQKFGWRCEFVDTDSAEAVEGAIHRLGEDKVKLIWVESLANPGGVVSDLKAVAQVADRFHVPLVVDNTLASPSLIKPIEYGASLVVHSLTKFISGSGLVMGGVVVDSGTFDWNKVPGKFPSLTSPEPAYHGLVFYETFGDLAFTVYAKAIGLRDLGPCLSAQVGLFQKLNLLKSASTILQGVETLSLRMERHCENALQLATYLEKHPKVKQVSYAGLPSSQFFERAKEYTPKGAGSVFTIELFGGYDEAKRVLEALQLFSHVAK